MFPVKIVLVRWIMVAQLTSSTNCLEKLRVNSDQFSIDRMIIRFKTSNVLYFERGIFVNIYDEGKNDYRPMGILYDNITLLILREFDPKFL